jgi:hypothetical protein
MTLRFLYISVIFLPVLAVAQDRKFLERVDVTAPQFYVETTAGGGRMDLVNFNAGAYAGLMIGTFNEHRRLRARPVLEQDSLLNRIALAAILSYNRNKYIYSGEWKKERSSIKYALHHQHASFKMYWAHAFALDVLDLDLRKPFYCDKKNPESDLSLYEGKKPAIIDPEAEGYVAPVPLAAVTDQEFCKRLLGFFSGAIQDELLDDAYSRIGVALKVDPRSIKVGAYRPRVFVIVVLGGKRLQEVRVPEKVANSVYNKLE